MKLWERKDPTGNIQDDAFRDLESWEHWIDKQIPAILSSLTLYEACCLYNLMSRMVSELEDALKANQHENT